MTLFYELKKKSFVSRSIIKAEIPYILKVNINLNRTYIFFFRPVYIFQSKSTQSYYLRFLRSLNACCRHRENIQSCRFSFALVFTTDKFIIDEFTL